MRCAPPSGGVAWKFQFVPGAKTRFGWGGENGSADIDYSPSRSLQRFPSRSLTHPPRRFLLLLPSPHKQKKWFLVKWNGKDEKMGRKLWNRVASSCGSAFCECAKKCDDGRARGWARREKHFETFPRIRHFVRFSSAIIFPPQNAQESAGNLRNDKWRTKREHAMWPKHAADFHAIRYHFHNISSPNVQLSVHVDSSHFSPSSEATISRYFEPHFNFSIARLFFVWLMEAIDEKIFFWRRRSELFQISHKVQPLSGKFQLTIVAFGLLGELRFVHVIFTLRHVGWFCFQEFL